eukprot:4673982-Pyramimonas_sp.AAC.1
MERPSSCPSYSSLAHSTHPHIILLVLLLLLLLIHGVHSSAAIVRGSLRYAAQCYAEQCQ